MSYSAVVPRAHTCLEKVHLNDSCWEKHSRAEILKGVFPRAIHQLTLRSNSQTSRGNAGAVDRSNQAESRGEHWVQHLMDRWEHTVTLLWLFLHFEFSLLWCFSRFVFFCFTIKGFYFPHLSIFSCLMRGCFCDLGQNEKLWLDLTWSSTNKWIKYTFSLLITMNIVVERIEILLLC